MHDYACIIFDLYNTILDDTKGIDEREKYRLDNIYTILEKSLFPVKFKVLEKKYAEMELTMYENQAKSNIAFTPFHQVDYLLNLLSIHDIVIFKKVYDCYIDALLQISPRLIKNADTALKLLKERGKKIGLISNTGKTSGCIIRLLLKQLGVYQYFDDFTFSDEIGFLKPDPLIFNTAVQKLGVPKSDIMFIGDLKNIDYDGAVNAGLNAHLFKKNEEDLYQLAVSYSGDFE
jgi:HAD superfamily hydrolase (TIGR01549 family)